MNTFEKELFSISLTDKERDNEDRLTKITDKLIMQLVTKKPDIQLAYDYYNCVRDKDRFKYLEDIYGLSNPSSLEFIPLVRRHIDYLIGQVLSDNINPKITCKDVKSLKKIKEQKESLKKDTEKSYLTEKLHNNIRKSINGLEIDESDPSDEINNIMNKIDQNFISDFEIAAQYLVSNILRSKVVNFKDKIKMMAKDYFITGQTYYRVNLRKKGDMPVLDVLHPGNVFYEKNYNSPYIKDAKKAVVVRFMTYHQIIDEFGDDLTDKQIDEIMAEFPNETSSSGNSYFIRIPEGSEMNAVPTVYPTVGTYGGLFGSDGISGFSGQYGDMLPVYDVEWIETFRKNSKIKTKRYCTTKIGQSVYILKGEDDDTVYNRQETDRAKLSVNGICNMDRSGKPYSLVLATSCLQDKYDLIFFHIDTLIATSGTKGTIVDVNSIPEYLADDPIDRIVEWNKWRKNGMHLIDSSELNAAFNTIFNGFNDCIDSGTLQAYQLQLQQIEYECSAVTGVYKESLNKIEQRDAVTNVQTGLKQSEIITKPLFHTIDNLAIQSLIDMINVCKISFKNGFVGNIVLNDINKVFTIEPQNFCFTDYDISLDDTDKTSIMMQKIDSYTIEMLKGQMVDPEVVINGITSESLTEMKKNLLEGIDKKKKEMSSATQLQQQNSQLQQQLQELQKQLEQANSELQNVKKENDNINLNNKSEELKIKRDELDMKSDIENKKLDLQKNQLQAEVAELFDGNKNNNEIKNI